jgi:uncharacterized protein (TIGR03437 family)
VVISRQPRFLPESRTILSFLIALAGFSIATPTRAQVLFLPNVVNDIVWDPTRSRFFASSGSSVLVINPESVQVEDSISTGDVAEKIAVSGDGQYLYVSIQSRRVVRRYNVQSRTQDLEFSLGTDRGGERWWAAALVVLPGQPQAVLVSLFSSSSLGSGQIDGRVAVFDRGVQRPETVGLIVDSFYVRPSDGSIYGRGRAWDGAPPFDEPRLPSHQIYWFNVSATGIAATNSVPIVLDGPIVWHGNLVTDRGGLVFDLDAKATLGVAARPDPSNDVSSCVIATDPADRSAIAFHREGQVGRFAKYSLADFRQTLATGSVNAERRDVDSACSSLNIVRTWGTNGFLFSIFQHSGGGSRLVFLKATDWTPVATAAAPTPTYEPAGVIRIPVRVNDIVFDETRNRIWASIPGNQGQIGNSVVSINPATGTFEDIVYAGSEPGVLARSSEGNQIFVGLKSTPVVNSIDLNSRVITRSFSVLDSTPLNGTFWNVSGIAAVPNQNDSVAVVRFNDASSTAVYDSGIPRPNLSKTRMTTLRPSGDPTFLYGTDLSRRNANYEHPLYRVKLDSNGLQVPTFLGPALMQNQAVFNPFVFHRDRIYTNSGRIYSADLKQVLGSLAVSTLVYGRASSAPVIFPERNIAVHAETVSSGVASDLKVTAYELDTLRPLLTVTIPALGQDLGVANVVRAGSDAVAISLGISLVIVPLSALQPWPASSGIWQETGPGLKRMELRATAISTVPGSSRLLLATPSLNGALGNSLVTVDVPSGDIEDVAFIGSEPTMLAPTRDGSSVYVFLKSELRVAKYNVFSRQRERVFVADPTGGSDQYELFDMAAAPDGGLAVSYFGGTIAIFDDERVRPEIDWNNEGRSARIPAAFNLAFDASGKILYGHNGYLTTFDLKRCAFSSTGIRWLSSAEGLTAGFDIDLRYEQGRIYTRHGDVVDPERSRIVARFTLPNGERFNGLDPVPDLASGRIYFLMTYPRTQIAVFDVNTYDFLGSLRLTSAIGVNGDALSLVKISETLAFNTIDRVYLLQTSAIPLLPTPIPSFQPTLPITPGVTVIDLAVQDLAYDVSRNLLYGSTPNSEAALGDRIVTVDPTTGVVVESKPAGRNPRLLELSRDDSTLYYSEGMIAYPRFGALPPEGLRSLDIESGAISQRYGARPPNSDLFNSMVELVSLPGQPHTIAALDFLIQNPDTVAAPPGTGVQLFMRPGTLKIFDNGVPRPVFLDLELLKCTSLQPGATASRLYCASDANFYRLSVNAQGVAVLGAPLPLPDTRDTGALNDGVFQFGRMIFSGGRVYTTEGFVIDPEAMQIITRVDARGPVAVSGDRVYWLDTRFSGGPQPSVLLRSFYISTLAPVESRRINVTAPNPHRLLPIGQGRLAFYAGREIYVVEATTASTLPPVVHVGGVVNGATFAAGQPVAPGSIASLFGANLALSQSDFISVTVNGVAAPIFAATHTQVNFQVPWEMVGQSQASVFVTARGLSASPVTMLLTPLAPGIFSTDSSGTGQGAILVGNSSSIAAPVGMFPGSRPIPRQGSISIYATGLGPVQSQQRTGVAASGSLSTTNAATVTIGGVSANVTYSGLAPGFIGLYQVNAIVPANSPTGPDVPITLTIGGVPANPVTIAVQ